MNIGRAAALSGVSARMIRHYEATGLVPSALRRDSGYRDYGDADVHRLRFIRRARDLGFALEEIGQLLALWDDRGRASIDVKRLAQQKAAELSAKADMLRAMQRTLEQLADACCGDDRPDCPILDDLSA